MVSLGATSLLGSSKTSFVQSHGFTLKPVLTPRRSAIRTFSTGRAALRVNAVATPESPTLGTFRAWDTGSQRVAKRTDLKSIMILGAGPIVIGQVCCCSSARCACVREIITTLVQRTHTQLALVGGNSVVSFSLSPSHAPPPQYTPTYVYRHANSIIQELKRAKLSSTLVRCTPPLLLSLILSLTHPPTLSLTELKATV